VVQDLGQEEEERILTNQLESIINTTNKITSFQIAGNAEGRMVLFRVSLFRLNFFSLHAKWKRKANSFA
jgi:Na+/H+-translocating membrane pyrophosphatase